MKYLMILAGLLFFIGEDYNKEIDYLQSRVVSSPYNKDYGILIDYSLHSGRKRMFLIDLKTKEVVHKFLVAHGSGSNSKLGVPTRFSNKSGSNASSLGISVISTRGSSRYGIGVKYVLKGLDETNNNIERRTVVLHSYKSIATVNTFPIPIVESQGCPTISNQDLRWLDKFIQKQRNKKIMMYSFKQHK